MENGRDIIHVRLLPLILLLGLGGITFSLISINWLLMVCVILLPLLFVVTIESLRYPIIFFLLIYTLNYYLLGMNRYVIIGGVSVIMDILMVILFVLIFIHSALHDNIRWKAAYNLLTVGSFVWLLYCLAEVINPSGMFEPWLMSRGLMINGFIVSLATALLCEKYKIVKRLIFLLSIFTLTAIIKALMQKYIGFDSAEQYWLQSSEAYKTHLLSSGTRYFSFFTDAGNFGSNMGCAGILFGITALYVKSIPSKIYYAIISIGGIYAMFLSGTRGAMIVPLGGLLLYTIISKNIKACLTGGILLIGLYIFFAFTSIGEGNAQIKRMRTAFKPSEDASYLVRKNNQKKLAEHLKNKPFGEGIGLSGVENRKYSVRLTTVTPNDSTYVKIWVETGIVGAVLYLGLLFLTIGKGAWILMFKIKDAELRGRLTGILCGIFGMLLSAYGNAFWTQYPTAIIAFTGLTLVLKAEHFDREISESKQITPINNI